MTPKKILNYCGGQLQHWFFRSRNNFAYPYEIAFETGNKCNLNCTLCPTNDPRFNHVKKGFLDFNLFKKVIDEIGEYLINVYLYNWGEPFLNQDIFRIIAYAKKKNINVIISTNLDFKDRSFCKKIVKSGVDKISVSLHGYSQKTAEIYQKGINLQNVLSNVAYIAAIKNREKVSHPNIRWKFIIMKHNEHEIADVRRDYKKLGFDRLKFSAVYCDMGKEIFMSPEEQVENIKNLLPANKKYWGYDTKKMRRSYQSPSCSFLWARAIINWDGSVFPCCMVYDPKYSFGNANDSAFKDIWNNDKYREARGLFSYMPHQKTQKTSSICCICKKNKVVL